MRELVHNRADIGEKGYDPIIDREQIDTQESGYDGAQRIAQVRCVLGFADALIRASGRSCGVLAEIEEDRERLLVEFELVGHEPPNDTGLPDFGNRATLPPRSLDDWLYPEPIAAQDEASAPSSRSRARPSASERFTFLNLPVQHGVPISALEVEIDRSQ